MMDAVSKLAELFAAINSLSLSEWEEGFIKSVQEQVELRGRDSLSDKQQTIIHDMYDKHEEGL